MNNQKFLLYLLVMAGVTYLVRMIPMVLFKEKIKNKFILSFLHYIPYTVLAVMTVPACFHATGSVFSAVIGFTIAVVAALRGKGLTFVAFLSCGGVFITELVMYALR
ncbi:MAG: AzlD domain-containing protein [Clostridia bacterium]|nr:AzlD domain-containing protein [Clostridia bacterium]